MEGSTSISIIINRCNISIHVLIFVEWHAGSVGQCCVFSSELLMAQSLCCRPEAKTRSWSDSHILIRCEERCGFGYLRVKQSAGSGLREQPKVRRLLLFFRFRRRNSNVVSYPRTKYRSTQCVVVITVKCRDISDQLQTSVAASLNCVSWTFWTA